MQGTELPYFIVFAIIILFSEFLPSQILLFLDNFIVRILIVFLLLYLTTIGPTAGIMGLVAISCIYLERNRRKISMATQKLDLMEIPKHATIEESSRPQTSVPVNDFDKPDEKETGYMPHKASNNFEPVANTINEKNVLTTVYPLKHPEKLYEYLGFGHIGI